MNIFVVDPDPCLAAESLCNQHVCKMTLESAQILSTVMHLHGQQGPYKPTHKNHPCVKWAAESPGNYLWLLQHFGALLEEYTYRWGKHHACGRLLSILSESPTEEAPRTPFVQCMPEKYKGTDPIEAYRAYYLGEKWDLPSGLVAQLHYGFNGRSRLRPLGRPGADQRGPPCGTGSTAGCTCPAQLEPSSSS